MGKYTLEQIKKIILDNPNKELITSGRDWRKRLMRHLHGVDLKGGMTKDAYFENSDVWASRSENPVSNRDLFTRLLHQEEMIFSARGGSSRFNINKDSERTMNSILDDVRFGQSLRKWVKNFALNAYRSDPMGLIFMEVEAMDPDAQNMKEPKCYPTYKCIDGIHDYLPNGRSLEYVCFQLTVHEVKEFGITEVQFNTAVESGQIKQDDQKSNYFRFVDDEKDIIIKRDGEQVSISNIKNNPISNDWGKVPGFIVSDLVQFDNPKCFASPVQFLVELADCFFYDRSIRDLQKKYHGFAKAVEPMLKCPTCEGVGMLKGSACPSCTLPGQDSGSGYKLQTKVSDKAMFPLSVMENGSFDIHKIFAYITPDIESWNKQDMSLEKLEDLMYFTYWGASNNQKTLGPSGKSVSGDATQETATKTLENLQPKYARLNATADWAEKTENMIANFIGAYWFDTAFKGSSISYSRNYILELPDDILNDFYTAREKGAPQPILKSLIDRYIQCLDQGNTLEAEKKKKLISVEPFVFSTVSEVEASTVLPDEIKLAKWFYTEWESTLLPIYVIETDVKKLREELYQYVKDKNIVTKTDNTQQIAELQKQLTEATSSVQKKQIQRKIDQLQTQPA